jgi:hypothetical protein|tara:strand:+ start:24 stop:248 length:225 start_codon:yes stop_codon:yes gene_type:complete
MKEQTLLNMKHDLSKLVETTQHIINDLVMVRTIASGSLQTIKLMPGYDEAIAKLQEEQSIRDLADAVESKLENG